ncbi:MAG TPA: hypothetical protein VF006_27650 [Longimicrobium sp.]
MMIAVPAVLLATPLSAQVPSPEPPFDAWRSMPVLDPRLRAGFADGGRNPADARAAELRMGLPHWALLGGVAGCIGGALILGARADEGEVAATRFNGCILGGAASTAPSRRSGVTWATRGCGRRR